jgi:phosphodiesterase/alkaline phosphatase D-like protein
VRFLLANLPVFMVFDDHEISDDWNITRGWLEQALKIPAWSDAITHGLIAYWMYQGWGNPLPAAGWNDPRMKVLSDAASAGTDALEPLRKVISPKPGQLDYYYAIESDPRIMVLDARHDRNFAAVPSGQVDRYVEPADELLSDKQWTWLEKQTQTKGPVIIVTSVPLLQFPWADFSFLNTVRPQGGIIAAYESNRVDEIEALRRKTDADSWAAFPASFLRMTQLLSRGGPFVFLSGDVHYSYASFDRVDLPATSDFPGKPTLLHAVSSPLRNQWAGKDTNNLVKRGAVLENPSMDAFVQMRSMVSAAAKANPKQPFEDIAASLSELRVFYPDPKQVFDKAAAGPFGKDYTYLNNVGYLQIAKDRTSAIVQWFAASTNPKTPLHIIGELKTQKGALVR